MGRKKDPIWDHVEKLNDKEFKCKKCGEKFAGGASRIKAHLLGIEGKGIRTCHGIPKDVQLATSSTFGDYNKAPYSTVNSCDPQHSVISNMPHDSLRGEGVLEHADVLGHVQTAPFSTINNSNQSIIMGTVNPISLEVNCLGFNQSATRDVNSSYAEVNSLSSNQSIMGNVDLGGPEENPHISNLNITRNINSSDLSREKFITGRKKDRIWQYVEPGLYGKVRCKFCRHEFVGGASRIKWHLSKIEKMGVKICRNVREDVQKAAEDTSNKRLKKNIISSHLEDNFVNSNSQSDSSKGNIELRPIPTSTDFIREEFQSYIDKVWDWLMNEKGSVIGVCGMGGVGKTTVLNHVYNKLLDHSHNVKWVDVPQNCSVSQLQKAIAESCDLHLSGWDGTTKITTELSAVLKKMKKGIIVLDNVWDHFNLDKLGIPLTDCEVQVIITSRLFNVCQIMGCNKHILRMMPLSEKNSWRLFFKVLGEDESGLSDEVTNIAKSIVDKCEGLPLAIATLATSMRGKEEIREWKYALENLRNKGQQDMKKSVLPSLALSYNHLNDKFLQECFLCCAFILKFKCSFLDGPKIFIIHLVDEGLMDIKNSLEAQLDEGHIILNKLLNNNLLIEMNKRDVRIHSLVGDMAASIAEAMNEVYMVKYIEDLRELEKKWTENLRRVRLDIKEIPLGTSPWFPKLSTLLLRYKKSLKPIPNSFFINMPSLKVLDLSGCDKIEHLPTSVSELESLTALLLCGCSSLKYVPSLAKLHKLGRLDLSGTAIIELPLGLEMLTNLRWLNLEGTQELIISSASVIPKLTNLQVFSIDMYTESVKVKVDDLKGLKALESISFNFSDGNEFNACVRGIVNSQNCGLRTYHVRLQGRKLYWEETYCWMDDVYSTNKTIRFSGIGNATSLLLSVDMNRLIIEKCDEWRSLCDVLSFDDRNKSKSPKNFSCKIRCCAALENVFCLNSRCSFCSSLQSIEWLELSDLNRLSMLTLAPWGPFSSLRYLTVWKCDSMKALLTDGMAGVLQNLETLDVRDCDAIEEIFSSEKNNERSDVEIEDYQLLEELLSSGMGRNYQEEQVADALQIHHTHPTMIHLPKLKSMFLYDLPQLNRVYEGILACNTLQKFQIHWCRNVKQLPQIQPLFQDFEILPPPYLEEEDSYASSDEELLIQP